MISWAVAYENDNCGSTVLARSGAAIDTSELIWILSAEDTINWEQFPTLPDHIRDAVEDYIKQLIRSRAPRYVVVAYNCLLAVFRAVQTKFDTLSPADIIDRSCYDYVRLSLPPNLDNDTVNHYLGAFLRWYTWCADAGLDGFDEDVAIELEERRLGRNRSGAAVLSQDPEAGPLNHVEFNLLITKLRSPEALALSLRDRCAVWLAIACGTNEKNMRLLHEDDLLKTVLNDGTEIYEIRIPRIKKGTVGERDQSRTRPLDAHIGRLVEALILENAEVRALDDRWDSDRFARPLFARRRVHDQIAITAFERDAYRQRRGIFSTMLGRVVEAFDLRAFPSNERLVLTTRRLRYTFATRLVEAGAPPVDVADALDHSDTSNVMTYYNSRSDVVTRLDKALALRMAPIAKAFLGKIISSEADAIRSENSASRIRHFDPERQKLENVGSCGNASYCGLFAPVACYTCKVFQPWLDAPHEKVLEHLLRQRDANLERRADPKFTQMNDLAIFAVAEVVDRCKDVRLSRAHVGEGS
ncbi:tyrosine-type recombinase/integrase [Pararoseomonas indoligenes]|uniref:Tyrosine-type recombinase/integrase n=1 Tax=Roseomonas indoligenes TaxID=2820811 RepID=A0A940MX21_9PROT|nr:tyrosine-type recombinase/integrase [Pararoseomonas indoligenes]MBP0495813.1 tyrosine-type recombinase/integrase [Pararoseomonas indoligenes]